MKALKDLTASDFPEIDPKKFEEWKQASIKANKNTVILLVVTIILIVGIFLVTGGILVGIIPLILFMVVNATIWSDARRLDKELGINRELLKRARSK